MAGASPMSASVYVRKFRSLRLDAARRFEFIAAGLRSVSPALACAHSTSATSTTCPSTTSAASRLGATLAEKSPRCISPRSQFLKTPPCPSASSLPWPVTSSIWSIVTLSFSESLHSR